MRDSESAWWETAEAGVPLNLAFVKLDRVGSTGEWRELDEDEVRRQRPRGCASCCRAPQA